MNGLISHIQRFSTKDGPGIRTTVFFKGCNLACRWCHNPEAIGKGRLMKFIPERCTDCGTCASVCGYGAAVMVNGRRWYDPAKCTFCGKCVEHCPADALEITGTGYTSGELTRLLLRDADYYRESDGGVTFSGGEPLLQAEFLKEVLRGLKAEGVRTALDTALCAGWNIIEGVLPYIDLVLLDIKGMDITRHRENTGVDPALIWENARKLASTDTKIIVRMPIVEGLNTDLSGIERAAWLVKDWKNLQCVELLPYHSLGVEKTRYYPALEPQEEFSRPSREFWKRAEEIFAKYGVEAHSDGGNA